MSGELPSRIGKYEIRGKLGRGAMGEVFRGHDPVLGREVAIKVMSVGHADAELLQRFQREAQSAARLNHPNIITVYDFGDEDGKLYMAMELLEGHDVKDVMGKLSFEEKLGLMEQVAEGLAFAHAKQVVHRDLKPANIHIQPNGQVKILDFGLAKLGGSDMTRTGTVMGTPFYMSPEQVRGEKVDARSDIFSIGSVFYELLTDHKPFTAESMHAVLFQVLQNEPESVRKWAPEVPGILVEVVEKCLAKDSAQRFADGGQLRDALAAVHRAIDGGRGDIASLAQEMPEDGQATVIERPKVARTGRGPGSSPRLASVSGATALERAPAAREDQPTMVGSAGTVRGATTRSAGSRTVRAEALAPEPASRAMLYVGVGAVVLALGGGAGYYFLKPGPPPTPAPTPGGPSGGLTQDLLATQLALARRQLDDKDWTAATQQAEQVLKLDPSNAEAERIREAARKARAEIEKTAGDARAAFEAGRMDEASAALSRLLALDPTHPTASELSGKLNGRFQAEAEEARREMRSAQAEAQRAGAGNGSVFVEAASLAREAEAFFGKGAFASAARQFLASKNAFGRARREVVQHPTPAPTTLPTTAPTPLPTPFPTPTAAPPTPTAHPATPPPPTAAPVADEEPAIRKVIADFARAIESKNLTLYKSLRPNLSAEDERKLKAAFEGSNSQQVSISIGSVQVTGGEARVHVTRRDTFKGRSLDPVQQTLLMVKGPGGWTIREVSQ
jgi:tetratricopeptide (TPR) repeat protein